MKKFLLLFIFLLPLMLNAQEKSSVVTLKNGTEITGVIKSIDPTDALTISIAGVETTIKMADVAKISEVQSPYINTTNTSSQNKPQLDSNTKLIIRDEAEYPEALGIKVGDALIKMILVRGGDMNMGFSGKHSISMDSEPVHPVKVTSFYISETYVTKDVYYEITQKKISKPYVIVSSWKKANEIVEKIAEYSGVPLRLPTEAEWEYAACAPEKDHIFSFCQSREYCSDWFDKYDVSDNQFDMIDPIGPPNGRRHVIRSYTAKDGKFDRSFIGDAQKNVYFRLAIKAKDILNKM